MNLQVTFARSKQTTSDNLYLRGVPSGLDSSSLNSLFLELGLAVKRSKVIPSERGASTCHAMVQLGSVEEATAAIAALDGRPFDNIAVAPVGPAFSVKGFGKGISKGKPEGLSAKFIGTGGPCENVYIQCIPDGTLDNALLEQALTNLGFGVVWAGVNRDKSSRGFSTAIVQVASVAEAAALIGVLRGLQIADLVGAAVPLPDLVQSVIAFLRHRLEIALAERDAARQELRELQDVTSYSYSWSPSPDTHC